MKEYAGQLYFSRQWKKTAKAYAKSQQGLCELCREQGLIVPGEIVHHKVFIDEKNINDPSVTLSFDNLQLVCRRHHAEIHERRKLRYSFDEYGHCIPKDSLPHMAPEG